MPILHTAKMTCIVTITLTNVVAKMVCDHRKHRQQDYRNVPVVTIKS